MSATIAEKPGRVSVPVGWQNTTDAAPSQTALSSLSFMAGCETDPTRWRTSWSTRKGFRAEVPDRDDKQACAWDTDVWRSLGPVESHKIHGSAVGTDAIPDNVPTPARFVHVKREVLQETGEKVAFVWSWWINSWKKPHGQSDFSTPVRRRLAKLARKTTRKVCAALRKAGYLVVLMGDFNSIVARLRFAGLGLKVVFGHGLDRMLVSRPIRVGRTWRLPKVGVGGDMRHEGLGAELLFGRAA